MTLNALKLLKNFADEVRKTSCILPRETPVEIWFQDEARVGQKNGITHQWALKGSRPRQPKDQRYTALYIFGAVCPQRDIGAALVMPYADTKAMQLHLEEISLNVAKGAHAIVVMDGWMEQVGIQPAN